MHENIREVTLSSKKEGRQEGRKQEAGTNLVPLLQVLAAPNTRLTRH